MKARRVGCPADQIRIGGRCISRSNTVRREGLSGMRPMVARVGGKTKLKKRIWVHVPEHKIYVEPFVGGGTAFWDKSLAPDGNVINDLDPALAKFYRDVKRGDPDIILNCRLPTNKKEFAKARTAQRPDGTFPDGCAYLKVIKRSYGGRGKIFNMPGIDARPNTNKMKQSYRMHTVLNNYEMYQAKLKKTRIESKDFCDVMKNNDSKDTFHFLDPPYWDTHEKYNLPKVHPSNVAGCCNDMKGKVLITYDNNPEVRKAFKGWKFETHDTKYEMQTANMNARGIKKDVTELMIMNYNPKTGERIKIAK